MSQSSIRFSLVIALAILLQTMALRTTLDAATPQLVGGFTQINMQDGGYLTGIVQHGSGRLIARTDGGGIYRSDNQGNWWTYLSSNAVTDAALVPQGIAVPQTANSSSNLILQACGYGDGPTDPGRGIWKSTDGGATWTQTLMGVNFSGGDNEREGGESLIFNPTNDLEAWAGSRGNGLWVSEDSGSTWTSNTTFPAATIVSSIYIHPTAPNPVFVGGDGGLWVSTNHGTNWTQLNTYSTIYRVTCGADGTVYYAGINGSTQVIQKITSANWGDPSVYVVANLLTAYQNGVGGNSGLQLITVTVLKDGRVVVSDLDSRTGISGNEGTTFSTLNMTQYAPGIPIPQWANPTTFSWHLTGLIQDVHNTNFWYGGAGYGPLATTNSGTNWQYIPNGIGEVVANKVGFHPTDPNRLYIPCGDLGGGIVTDGGLSGNTAAIGHQYFPSDNSCCQVSHRALSCYTNGHNRVIFPGGGSSAVQARLYTSTNDGASWYYPGCTNLPTNTTGTFIVDAVDSLDNPDDFLVVCGGTGGTNLGGVYRTTNAGASFTQCNWYVNNTQTLGTPSWYTVYLDRDATNVNVRYLFGHVSYPSDPAVSPYTNTGGGFFYSSDRGVNWTQITGEQGAVINNDWGDWWSLSMAADHGVSRSVWVALAPGKPGQNGLAHTYNAMASNTFYAVPGVTNALAVDALNGNVVFAGQMSSDSYCTIYYSTNNGTNWAQVSATNYQFGNTHALALDPHRPGRIFICNGERSVGIFTPGTPMQQWQLNYFMSTSSSQSAPWADPNSNTIPNLLEYALGADPLAGVSGDPLGPGSTNGTNYMPRAAMSTNPALLGQPVLRVNLPDPPPSNIQLQVISSSNLLVWNTNATRAGANAWQWSGTGSSLVVTNIDTNGRAIFDIGTPSWAGQSAQIQCLQVKTN